jgi:predicted methyltransferase
LIHPLGNARERALYHEVFDLLSEGGVFLNAEHVASPTDRVEKMLDECFKLALFAGWR